MSLDCLLMTSSWYLIASLIRYLEGDARRLRHTAVLSAHAAPELSALMLRGCANISGRVITTPSYEGILGHAPVALRQLFMRFEVGASLDDPTLTRVPPPHEQ